MIANMIYVTMVPKPYKLTFCLRKNRMPILVKVKEKDSEKYELLNIDQYRIKIIEEDL